MKSRLQAKTVQLNFAPKGEWKEERPQEGGAKLFLHVFGLYTQGGVRH